MSQLTNLNKNPYYDDFDAKSNYYKVLFKPGISVQTRELNNLQSILQDQIDKFGNKFFSNGGIVVPGGFAYDNLVGAVEVESFFNGIDVETYYESFVGKTLTGKESNISAVVEKVLSKTESERGSTTLYLKYLNSSSTDFSTELFANSEDLIINSDILVGSSFIFSGESVCKVSSPIDRSPCSVASSVKIEDGIYFIRGYFVNISEDIIILDQYSNTPSYRVGLQILEELVDSNEDPTLNDNARGFSNYAAPGADRFKISTNLIKKSLTDFNDTDFIELIRIESGVVRKIKSNDESSFISDILARRTYDESGNYSVTEFDVECLESLTNNLGNSGVYNSSQLTYEGSVPSNDLGLIKVSPGKAYVKGYEVATSSNLLDYPKPRTTKRIESSSSNFYAGNILRVNNASSVPKIGLSTDFNVSLYSTRLTDGVAVGTTIGIARIYDFEHHNTSYEGPESQFNLNLFDIQTYTSIVSTASTAAVTVGSYLKGNDSGASGFVNKVTGANITLQQVSGSFSVGEGFSCNGIGVTVSIGTVTDYSVGDIKSVGITSALFYADSLLSNQNLITGPFTVNASSGIATITSNNGSSFAKNLKVNDIIKYSRSGISSDVYVGITSIFNTNNRIIAQGVSTVENVCSGDPGSTQYTVENIFVIRPQILQLNDSSLYSKLNHSNISNVELLNSSIFVKRYNQAVTKSSTTLTLPSLSGTDYVYASFDEERYVVVNNDGSIENLSNATLTITNGGKNAEFTNLSATSGPCKVISTQIKSNVSSKSKKYTRCQILDVEKTKYSVPKNAGLAYTTTYGTRVEDDEISLNVADIVQVHAVLESSTTSDPAIPAITFTGLNSVNSSADDLIIGELIVGTQSGATAIYVSKVNSTKISIVYKNDLKFEVDETIEFKESGYTCEVSSLDEGDPNILNEFILDNGQRKHYYDFGRIKRVNGSREPSSRLKIVFDYFKFDSTDSGDVVTVNSYPNQLYQNNIPSFENIRNTDVIDVRPRVSEYSSNIISPFDYSSRNFNVTSNNSAQILSSNEDFIFDYEFYLPRNDKLTLSKSGEFDLVFGQPSESPIDPVVSNEVLEVASIRSNAYVYDVSKDVTISLTDNKRYTMSDLRSLEERIETLEYYTSLNLLELSTRDLLIEDSNGLNRFKSGFFVDNFNSYITSDLENASYKASISNGSLIPILNQSYIPLNLYADSNENSISEVNLSQTNSSNLKITGSSLSLNYSNQSYIFQNFASQSIKVNPYNVISWNGYLNLSPECDNLSSTVDYKNYFKSRNIEFNATKLKPNTKHSLVFDSRNLSSVTDGKTYAFPKLLQISDVIGTFVVGETVVGKSQGGFVKFRICSPNHKFGPHDNPTKTYSTNPYDGVSGLSNSYGAQSTILNVDISTLQSDSIPQFFGNILSGMDLYGLESKAIAKVSKVDLVSDSYGNISGCIFIPDPSTNTLKFKHNNTLVKLISENSDSFAEFIFSPVKNSIKVDSTERYNPLSQTFSVLPEGGIVLTSVEIFFRSKSSMLPISLEIREVVNGVPGNSSKLVGNLRKTLLPSEVNVSTNASVSTTFEFDSLFKLEGGVEYALVLTSNSSDYQVWSASVGSVDVSTLYLPEVNTVIISKQPLVGNLFTSQNGYNWIPTSEQSLKFRLNKAVFTSSGTVRLYNSSLESESIGTLLPNNPLYTLADDGSNTAPYDGNHIKVLHPNHGMYGNSNKVEIKGVQSDILPVKLTSSYSITSTGAISVESDAIFANFEGSAVDSINPGYIKIGEEIIKYEGISSNQLTGITRGALNTPSFTHPVNSLVYKYEFNGVSLSKINTVHTVDSSLDRGIDYYYISIPISEFNQDKIGGGSEVYASENITFGALKLNPNFTSSYNNTSVDANIRSISATSVDGSEVSYIDNGFESFDAFNENAFKTLGMTASRVNENQYLNATQFTSKKSLTLDLNLSTSDSNISPILDLNQNGIISSTYEVNRPIALDAYPSDSTVNSNLNDEHAYIHISEKIEMQESATSLKVLLSAYRHSSSDIRVLYKIFRNDVPDEDQIWELFPGYDNLDVNGDIINLSNNDGKSDVFVPSSLVNEYKEYSFTIDNLPEFTAFAIKIVGSSDNQCYAPIIKDLRCIALK